MDVLAQDSGSLNLNFHYHGEAYKSYMGNIGNTTFASVNTKSIDIEFSLEISYSSKEELSRQLDAIGEMLEDVMEDADDFLTGAHHYTPGQTAERIVQNILDGANGDLNLMRSGREGMLQGFRDFHRDLGHALHEQTKETMRSAIEILDRLLNGLGTHIIDEKI
jgi:hypothetical protein